jgi:hypothetical protein
MYQHIMETWHLDPTIDLMLEEATLGKTQTLSKRFSEFLLFFSGSKRGMGKPRIYPHLPTIWGCFYSLGTSIFMVKLSIYPIYPIYPYLCISILFYPIYPYLFISILSFLPILSILSILSCLSDCLSIYTSTGWLLHVLATRYCPEHDPRFRVIRVEEPLQSQFNML